MIDIKVFTIWETAKGFSRVSIGAESFKALTSSANPTPYKTSTDAKGDRINVYTLADGLKVWTKTIKLVNEDGSPKLNEKNYQMNQTFVILKEEDAKKLLVSEPDTTEQYDIDFDFKATI